MKATTSRKPRSKNNDLPDSDDDRKHLRREEATLDLPEVKDIPGQEHVRPMPPGEMADTTLSSADEEAEDLLDTDEDKVMMHATPNVSREEKELLAESSQSMGSDDDLKLKQARVDTRDEDGTPLNERVTQSGGDLDVPGSEEDDANESLGEEDEENNPYSLRGEKEEQNNGKQ